jgi:hypothetical protein
MGEETVPRLLLAFAASMTQPDPGGRRVNRREISELHRDAVRITKPSLVGAVNVNGQSIEKVAHISDLFVSRTELSPA